MPNCFVCRTRYTSNCYEFEGAQQHPYHCRTSEKGDHEEFARRDFADGGKLLVPGWGRAGCRPLLWECWLWLEHGAHPL